MKRFHRERLLAIQDLSQEQKLNTHFVIEDGIGKLVGATTGRTFLTENTKSFQTTAHPKDNEVMSEAIRATEPKIGKEMNSTNQVIDATKKDATDIATAVTKRIAAEKLLIAAGVPLEGLLKKMGLNPELARSPLAPAIVAVIGLLVTNSIQDLPKKQLVHELCSLYLEQSAVNLLSPILGDLVTTFTQAIESVE